MMHSKNNSQLNLLYGTITEKIMSRNSKIKTKISKILEADEKPWSQSLMLYSLNLIQFYKIVNNDATEILICVSESNISVL